MFIYAGGRRSGKTAKMIEWFLADPQNRIIVTPNKIQAEYIKKRILEVTGSFGDFPFLSQIISYHDTERLLRGSRNFEIGTENLDLILHQVFHNSVEFATVTGVKFDAPKKKPWWKFW